MVGVGCHQQNRLPFQQAKYAIMILMIGRKIQERGSFLRDAVFAASDGLVTTFAVVAGSQGASLGPVVVVIMGFANLFADGISMSSGTYLGVKSEVEFEKAEGDTYMHEAAPLKQALLAFLSFDLAGLIPIVPYVLGLKGAFYISITLVFIVLFIIGILRGRFTRKFWIKSGFEMLFVGGAAAVVAYSTGYIIETIILK
jgi:VIT1/CCC1 family predicted Fe2+/Mn2+ transporter